MRRIGIVVLDGAQALDVAGPLDVFAETNAFVTEGRGYETVLISKTLQPLRASNGMRFIADETFDSAEGSFAVLLAAGGPTLPGDPPDEAVSHWMRQAAERSELYGSICTGAFILGHAGLLDGHAVTTHWQNAARLATLFPNAQVEHDRIYLRDRRLITSAGVTAGIDLALALVREHHGATVARAVAKRLVVMAQRQGGQSQFSPFMSTPADETSALAKVQAYVLDHVGERFTTERLAEVAGTSMRNLARLFEREASVTPHAFVENARVDVARNLLEGTSLPFKAIAFDCGFGTADRMRLVFARRLGVSPAQYRSSFQGLDAGAGSP